MPSLAGLKTWFEYEVLLAALAFALFVAFWGTGRIATVLERVPLSSPRFALGFTVACLATLAILIRLAGRYG